MMTPRWPAYAARCPSGEKAMHRSGPMSHANPARSAHPRVSQTRATPSPLTTTSALPSGEKAAPLADRPPVGGDQPGRGRDSQSTSVRDGRGWNRAGHAPAVGHVPDVQPAPPGPDQDVFAVRGEGDRVAGPLVIDENAPLAGQGVPDA